MEKYVTYLWIPWTDFAIMGPNWTYHASRCVFSWFFSLSFLFVPCDELSWLHVSFLLHVKYTISYRILKNINSEIKTNTMTILRCNTVHMTPLIANTTKPNESKKILYKKMLY